MAGRGKRLENKLAVQHRAYENDGLMAVEKVHPEARIIRGELIYTREGPPDYMGVFNGGVMFALEAKETATERWPFEKLADHQAKRLEMYALRGGQSFLVIDFRAHGPYLCRWPNLSETWWKWRSKESKQASIRFDDPRLEKIHGYDWYDVARRTEGAAPVALRQ